MEYYLKLIQKCRRVSNTRISKYYDDYAQKSPRLLVQLPFIIVNEACRVEDESSVVAKTMRLFLHQLSAPNHRNSSPE